MGNSPFHKFSDHSHLDHVLMDYGQMLYPGKGLGDCCISAGNTMQNIDNEVNGENASYHRKKVMLFKTAMSNRLRGISVDTQEALILRFMVGYLSPIEDFLKHREDPEDDTDVNPERLRRYVSCFESLKPQLSQFNPLCRAGLEQRVDLAIEWCESNYRRNAWKLPSATASLLSASNLATKSNSSGCLPLLFALISTFIVVAATLSWISTF